MMNTFWQYLGAAFTENKSGKQAISLTRTLSVVCFSYLSYKWLANTAVDDTLVWTFWVLIGGKTAETMVSKIPKKWQV